MTGVVMLNCVAKNRSMLRAGGMTRVEEPAVNSCAFARDVSCLDLVTDNHNQLIFSCSYHIS